MSAKEAKARIKINNLLQESGWRLLDDHTGKANVVLENNVKITHTLSDDMGEDFEKTTNGYADYLLLDERGLLQKPVTLTTFGRKRLTIKSCS